MLRRQKIRQPSEVSEAEVTLPPLETLSVQLSALSLVTRGMNAKGVDLAPMLDRDRKKRLMDVSGVTAVVSVLDTICTEEACAPGSRSELPIRRL